MALAMPLATSAMLSSPSSESSSPQQMYLYEHESQKTVGCRIAGILRNYVYRRAHPRIYISRAWRFEEQMNDDPLKREGAYEKHAAFETHCHIL